MNEWKILIFCVHLFILQRDIPVEESQKSFQKKLTFCNVECRAATSTPANVSQSNSMIFRSNEGFREIQSPHCNQNAIEVTKS